MPALQVSLQSEVEDSRCVFTPLEVAEGSKAHSVWRACCESWCRAEACCVVTAVAKQRSERLRWGSCHKELCACSRVLALVHPCEQRPGDQLVDAGCMWVSFCQPMWKEQRVLPALLTRVSTVEYAMDLLTPCRVRALWKHRRSACDLGAV